MSPDRKPFGESVESNTYHPGTVVGSDPVPQNADYEDTQRSIQVQGPPRGELEGSVRGAPPKAEPGRAGERPAPSLNADYVGRVERTLVWLVWRTYRWKSGRPPFKWFLNEWREGRRNPSPNGSSEAHGGLQ